MVTIPPSAPPAFHLLAKPTGAVCNLDCTYCFFLSKEALYPGSRFRMADDMLETYIRQLIESQPHAAEVSVAWQGGEPTLMGLEFFRRAVVLAEQYKRPGQRLVHTMQTNGTKIDDDWAAFFKAHDFLIGLSVDGPRDIHDTYRVNKGGAGSFDQVMRGHAALVRHGVEFNILCTVHAANQERPLDVYHFFRDDLGARFIQFIPIIERSTAAFLPLAELGWSERHGGQRPLYVQAGELVTERSVVPDLYGRFLCAIFDEWVRRDVGTVFVQMFDVTLGAHVGQYSLCVHSPTCGNALALEHNGDLYSCDHFVEPDYKLGNINEQHMIELVASERQRRFGWDKMATLPAYCQSCEVRYACHGGCPKDRFTTTPDGEPGLNYLCPAYKRFFSHVEEPMQVMAGLVRSGRYADEIMARYQAEQPVAAAPRPDKPVGRNAPCPCGSGKKFKQCHGKAAHDG
jgi:uncharacterized protein